MALKEDAKPKQDGCDESFYNSQKFEVLYRGKVTVAHKKAPATLVDDCIDKFRQHEVERKRLRLLNGQRGSTESAPVEFVVGGDDPLGATTTSSSGESPEGGDSVVEEEEEEEGLTMMSDPLGGGAVFGLSTSASVGSLRSAFPECILEDSGFEEQDGRPEPVRARCNSLAGSTLQRKAREAALKAAPQRRRHASAPNHVQPSDADKNRTMLFQVCLSLSSLCFCVSLCAFSQPPCECVLEKRNILLHTSVSTVLF